MTGERGRPRSFDVDAALDRALSVFWKHGFQGASLTELTDAMGLSKPSLYAAFGDKEALYLQALARYAKRWLEEPAAWLEHEPDGRRALEGFLRRVAAVQADPALPGGCFIINGTADLGVPGTPATVEAALRTALQGTEVLMEARLRRAQAEGQLAADADPAALAAYFNAVLTGMAVRAKGGVAPERFVVIIDAAMAAWPGICRD